MSLKRILTLGAAALVALALAAPASAVAAEWKHEGAPLAEHVEIGLTGGEVFVTEAGGMICNAAATLTTEGGSSGEIINYETTKCMGLFGELSACEVVATEEVPWGVDVNATDLTITGSTLVRVFDPECPVGEIESTIPAMTAFLVEPEAITEIEYFGGGSASIDGGSPGEYEAFGSWSVAPEASGTYGIG